MPKHRAVKKGNLVFGPIDYASLKDEPYWIPATPVQDSDVEDIKSLKDLVPNVPVMEVSASDEDAWKTTEWTQTAPLFAVDPDLEKILAEEKVIEAAKVLGGFCKYCGSQSGHSCDHCDCLLDSEDYCHTCDRCVGCCNCHDDDDDDEVSDEFADHDFRVSQVGWVRRSQEVKVKRGGIDQWMWRRISPPAAMADFYVLEYITAAGVSCIDPELNIGLTAIVDLAIEAKNKLVAELDPVFQTYVDMVIGGEIRHHPAVGRTFLNSERETAWEEWGSIRRQVGPDALVDAQEIFMDMPGDYGGEPWALAAKVLHSRVTNQIPAWLFVDRVFAMQHNGGSLLNKVTWKTHHRLVADTYMMHVIGDAHAADDTDIEGLLVFATDEVAALFRQWWMHRNRILVHNGKRPEMLPTPWYQMIREDDRIIHINVPTMGILWMRPDVQRKTQLVQAVQVQTSENLPSLATVLDETESSSWPTLLVTGNNA